ncbi:nitroreductase family protein [Mycobacterium sp. CVI_P3]|uniref:Nitroreductase family protein n=1 Tax=Mycobacterium pinniadriaticum TaxID=2994102 RepID=A0ABT3S975_9MYCO|nr:nitroreductase family protein [Mycobacterium pinniadriaticum]MCX2929642.1 nitroreductase family protein [Mycobacterium pinniadriaticum]MCX2936066.1 nitroreductase family protein [Mycobacterium pinniadriaticum]
MDKELPDRETVEAALALAVRAPSVHNSQPWRWRVGDESVHIYADPTRHLPRIDPERRDLMLSCGVALHHFTVALSALGWAAEVQRFPNPADPDHLASVSILGPVLSEQDIALAAAIPRRRTDRRWFSSWPVPTGDIALMAARATQSGVTLRRVEDEGELAQVVAHAVREHISDPAYLAELSMWSGRYGTQAGVPARNTPPAEPHGKFAPRVFANPVLQQPSGIEARDDAGVVLVLATATDNPESLLRAGEATSVVLLTATALGLASCPLTEPLEIAATRAEVRAKLLGGDGFPQMLLRVGWAALNADPLPATPRRMLSDIAARLDGSPLGVAGQV